MEDLKVQQNLEKNIEKVFEKIQEEGIKGAIINENCYPIEEILNVELKNEHGMFVRVIDTGKRIKDYNDYMKLIRTLDTLINMYSHISINDFDVSDKIRIKIENEIKFMQNTGLESLDKGFISQYSCLIKCYDSLLRMSRMFVIKPIKNLP